jgi:flavin reductase (DIM6/NTAB) family NADH-FMN oxidoreductase RutF
MKPEDIHESVFKLLNDDWMLITAGTMDKHNEMTASWGSFGIMWGRPICNVVIRPQRYTFEFMERYPCFTLSFFDERYRAVLELCGSKSGREIDKTKQAGLTPVAGSLPDTVYFEEARMILECRKIYYHDINPAFFMEPSLEQNYPWKDYHRMYTGEITSIWKQD